MIPRLPKKLIIGLAIVALVSFGFSLYLESTHLGMLQRHPIMVNLTSSVVAFSSGILTFSIGLNWFVKRDRMYYRRALLVNAWWAYESGARSLVAASCPTIPMGMLAPAAIFDLVRGHNFPIECSAKKLGVMAGAWIRNDVERLIEVFGMDESPQVQVTLGKTQPMIDYTCATGEGVGHIFPSLYDLAAAVERDESARFFLRRLWRPGDRLLMEADAPLRDEAWGEKRAS